MLRGTHIESIAVLIFWAYVLQKHSFLWYFLKLNICNWPSHSVRAKVWRHVPSSKSLFLLFMEWCDLSIWRKHHSWTIGILSASLGVSTCGFSTPVSQRWERQASIALPWTLWLQSTVVLTYNPNPTVKSFISPRIGYGRNMQTSGSARTGFKS